jgi:hypothetical protein
MGLKGLATLLAWVRMKFNQPGAWKDFDEAKRGEMSSRARINAYNDSLRGSGALKSGITGAQAEINTKKNLDIYRIVELKAYIEEAKAILGGKPSGSTTSATGGPSPAQITAAATSNVQTATNIAKINPNAARTATETAKTAKNTQTSATTLGNLKSALFVISNKMGILNSMLFALEQISTTLKTSSTSGAGLSESTYPGSSLVPSLGGLMPASLTSSISQGGKFLPKGVLLKFMETAGFKRTDKSNSGHSTSNHLLNAMDLGYWAGDDYVAKTKEWETRLRSTRSFGDQLLGPISDWKGHGEGKPGNTHLHIPTPNGLFYASPELINLMREKGFNDPSLGLTTASVPRAPGGATGMGNLEVNAPITIHQQPGQDPEELATIVVTRLSMAVEQMRNHYA